MNNRKSYILFCVFVMMVILPQVSYAEENFIEQFGVTEGSPVNKGFVFLDGQYIEPPYVVSREGLTLLINGRKIERPARHPGLKPLANGKSPENLTVVEREKLSRGLEATRGFYEEYLIRDCGYMFFSSGGHIRLSPYTVAYDLLDVIKLLESNKSRNEKLKALELHNWHLSVNIEPLVDNFSTTPDLMLRLKQKADELLRIEEFGTNAETVDNGFVFFEGQYLEAPYEVERRGLGVFINDKMVYRPLKWPNEKPSIGTNPAMPKEITSESSIYDEIVKRYLWEKQAYLSKHTNSDEEARLIEQAIRDLPFVTDAHIDEKDPHIIHFATTEGLIISQYLISMRGREVKWDKASVLERIEKRREHFYNALDERGACFIFTSKGGWTRLCKSSIEKKLPSMIAILKSQKPAEQKLSELQESPISLPSQTAKELVENFSLSPQLEARLNELTQSK